MEKNESFNKQEGAKEPGYAQDEQTGKVFKLKPERYWDVIAATIGILYSIAMLIFFSWLLFDLCTDNRSLLKFLILQNVDILESPIFRLIVYAVIGGGLGGTINGIRSIIIWHCERAAFGWRFIWKNITHPLLGAVLAAIVYAIIRGGIAAFEGGLAAKSEPGGTQAFSAFAIGALSGYGSHKVFRWLDEQVNKLFRISPPTEIKVPDLTGKTKNEAEALLKEAKLNVGKIDYKPSEDPGKIDKVVAQIPPSGSNISVGGSIDITIGAKT